MRLFELTVNRTTAPASFKLLSGPVARPGDPLHDSFSNGRRFFSTLLPCLRPFLVGTAALWAEPAPSRRHTYRFVGRGQLGRTRELLPVIRTNVLLITDTLARDSALQKAPTTLFKRDRPYSQHHGAVFVRLYCPYCPVSYELIVGFTTFF